MTDAAILDRAEAFLWENARLLERLRFDHLFRGGDPDRVVVALRPYQNADGGFGAALEPDLRTPLSQPLPTSTALGVLAEVDRPLPELVLPACGYLAALCRASGAPGLSMATAAAAGSPMAPFLTPSDEADLIPTGPLAGFLHRYRFDHPWLAPATDYCWRALAGLPDRLAAGEWVVALAYEARAAVAFLDFVPDRSHAEAAAANVGEALLAGGAVSLDLDPAAAEEATLPLDLAATPDTLARRWFDQALLDALAAAQEDDGGWSVAWAAWAPANGPEWRGIQTLERLKTLRAYGRL